MSEAGHQGAGAPNGLLAALQTHERELRRFLRARSGDADSVDDLMQEMWLRCRAAPPVPVENMRAYLYRVANNLVLDRHKAERRRLTREGDWLAVRAIESGVDDPARGDAAMQDEAVVARLAHAIAQLPPAAGLAFRLNKLEGMKQDAVARQMGISRSGVEKHIALAMARLRQSMRGED